MFKTQLKLNCVDIEHSIINIVVNVIECIDRQFKYLNFRVQDESLKWLIANGKTKEIKRILRKVSKWNKLDYGELFANVNQKMNVSNMEKPLNAELQLRNNKTAISVEKYSILTILQNRSLLWITLLMGFVWQVMRIVTAHLEILHTLNFFCSKFVNFGTKSTPLKIILFQNALISSILTHFENQIVHALVEFFKFFLVQ